MVKKCARCGDKFKDVEGFLTCDKCRVPLPDADRPDGCHFWHSAAPDPRVNYYTDIVYTMEQRK